MKANSFLPFIFLSKYFLINGFFLNSKSNTKIKSIKQRISSSSHSTVTKSTTYTIMKGWKLQDVNEIWFSRRKLSKSILSPIAKFNLNRELKPKMSTTTTNTNNNALIISTLVISIGTIVLRLGGRGAFVQLLGLDFIADSELKNQINSFVTYFQSLDNLQYLYFFLAWFFVKLLCIDALTIVLAVSSGVLFQGLFQGTFISVFCSSISSLIIFLLSRKYLKSKVQQQIMNRPALKAIDRACTKNGFKTVFTLRISPILPIPVAAYNYIYGIMSVSPQEFLLGITLGSIKPYMLDCYLGLFGKSLIEDSSSGTLSMVDDIVLISIVSIVVLVGVFATQIATSTWQEINEEINSATVATIEQTTSGEDNPSSLLVQNNLDFFQLFGIKDEELPIYLRTMKSEISEAWIRVDTVIQDEWRILSESLGKKKNETAEIDTSIINTSIDDNCNNNNIQETMSNENTINKEKNYSLDHYDHKRIVNDYEIIDLKTIKTTKELIALTMESLVYTFVLLGAINRFVVS